MTEKRITRAGILFLLICALLLCACAAPAAGSNGDTAASPQPSAPAPAPEQSPDASDTAAEPENTGDAGDRTVVYAATAEDTAARLAKMKRRKREADSSKRIGKRRTNG